MNDGQRGWVWAECVSEAVHNHVILTETDSQTSGPRSPGEAELRKLQT